MDSKMQVQVQVGDTRRVFFMDPPKTYGDLERAVSREIPKTRTMEFGLMYENDEKEYVVMSSDPICLRVAISSSKCIEGTDVPRLKLRVFEGSSPSVKSKVDERFDQCKVPSSTSALPSHHPKSLSTRLSTSSPSLTTERTARACLHREFVCYDESDEERDSVTDEEYEEKTPLERYVLNGEKKIKEKKAVIQHLREKIEETGAKLERVKSDPRDGNICRNCHLRLGHSARNCDFGKCLSVFKCGMEKFHPGEVKIKEMRSQLRKHENELSHLEEELRNKKKSVESARDKAHVKIENDLLQANKNAYIVNGNKNWSLLRKHVFLVQEYCKTNLGGKIPGKQDIESILQKAVADIDNNESFSSFPSRVKQHGKRSRNENPAKSSLERLGVEFPSSKYGACSSETKQILCSAPSTEEEEEEQLNIVLRESLHQQNAKLIPRKAQPREPQPEENMNFPLSEPYPPHFPTGFDYPLLHGAHNLYGTMQAMPIAENLPREYPLTGVWPYPPANVLNSVYASEITQPALNFQTTLYPPSTTSPPAYHQNTTNMERAQSKASLSVLPLSYSIVEAACSTSGNNTSSDDKVKENAASILLNLSCKQNQGLEN